MVVRWALTHSQGKPGGQHCFEVLTAGFFVVVTPTIFNWCPGIVLVACTMGWAGYRVTGWAIVDGQQANDKGGRAVYAYVVGKAIAQGTQRSDLDTALMNVSVPWHAARRGQSACVVEAAKASHGSGCISLKKDAPQRQPLVEPLRV